MGIASGNTATLVPVVMLCALPLLYMYLQATGSVPPKEEYTNEEVCSMLALFLMFMLVGCCWARSIASYASSTICHVYLTSVTAIDS